MGGASGAHQATEEATRPITIEPTMLVYAIDGVTATRPASTPHDSPSRLCCCAAMSKKSHVRPPTAAAICSRAEPPLSLTPPVWFKANVQVSCWCIT